MAEGKALISVPVQNLIEYTLQTGSLGMGVFTASRAVEGTRGHQTVRKKLKAVLPENAVYTEEVPVSYCLEGTYVILEVTGRIDGILQEPGGTVIHEIKTTTLPLDSIEHDHRPMHWAQAKCYAFIHAQSQGLAEIAVRLTYYQLDDKLEKSFTDDYTIEELGEFFLKLAQEYLEWLDGVHGWQETRNHSISALSFPYPEYRKGQKDLATRVYRTVRSQGTLFVQAPTGTGKTIATLFPAIKALGEGLASRIFYLTAKTTTRTVAEKAIRDMRDAGLEIKSLTLTAKEKICFQDSMNCHPELCEYSEGYFDRVKQAVREAMQTDHLDRETIEYYAARHRVCPFELSLDLSLHCDIIICDYNYLFDPLVYLKRFFLQPKSDACFLVDEAHNLVDRARDMYSPSISKKAFLELKRVSKMEWPGLYEICNTINKTFIDTGKLCVEAEDPGKSYFFHVDKQPPKDLRTLLVKFSEMVDTHLSRNRTVSFQEQLLDTFLEVFRFLKILDFYDERYVTFYEKTREDFTVRLFCMDPSFLLREAMKRGKASILFSATLSPMDYYIRILGGDENTQSIRLSSPFPRENLCVYMEDTVSTRFKIRQLTYDRVAECILRTAQGRTGNYMAFFPSFDYMNEVYLRFHAIKTGIRTLYQTPGMSDESRQAFLDEFSDTGETSLVGFAVMGGIFGEGIDLIGDRLSGAIIVGVGLPQVCSERNVLREYFEEQSGSGFEFAYLYPGMNRVLQAAGRVIRSEEDRGVVILLDERFAYSAYKSLLPSEWLPIPRAGDGCTLEDILEEFWRDGV